MLSLEYLSGVPFWQHALQGTNLLYWGTPNCQCGKICLYIFSKAIYFLQKKSSVFSMGGLVWLQDFGEVERGLRTPMIHMHLLFNLMLHLALYCTWCPWALNSFFFISPETKAASSCLKWVGVCKLSFMGVLRSTMWWRGTLESVCFIYSCQPILCFSFWSLSNPLWFPESQHYSLRQTGLLIRGTSCRYF